MPTIRGLSTSGVEPHASTHKSGGSDPIKLDELAAPTDVTTLNVSTSAHGLTPKLPNDATKYLDGSGAYSVPAGSGGAGRYLLTTVKTSGTSITTGASTNTIRIRVQAGGGGGGGAASNTASPAGGGGAGGYAEKTFAVSPSTAYTYAIGAAGAGGTAGNNNGSVGGNSTFAVGATTVTASGGKGGIGSAGLASGGILVLGGAAAAVSTNGDLNASGAPGGYGTGMASGAAGSAASGAGGSCVFGAGGNSRNTQGTGAAGVGFGAGGSGGCSIANGGNVAGGAGLAGVIIIDEYS